jgi:hypothetical protein
MFGISNLFSRFHLEDTRDFPEWYRPISRSSFTFSVFLPLSLYSNLYLTQYPTHLYLSFTSRFPLHSQSEYDRVIAHHAANTRRVHRLRERLAVAHRRIAEAEAQAQAAAAGRLHQRDSATIRFEYISMIGHPRQLRVISIIVRFCLRSTSHVGVQCQSNSVCFCA